MAPAPLDPLTEIATPEALRDWLDGLDLADLAPAFIDRDLLGQALLETDPADLAALAGPAAGLLGKQLERLRRRRAALTPAMTRAELIAGADYCRVLGRDWAAEPWLPGLVAGWPGPIAHEVQVLGKLLERGQAAGALWQLRDLAEVLIKVPAVILARDLLEHQAPPAVQERIQAALYDTALTMGTWFALARDLAKTVAAGGGTGLLAPALAGLFWQGGKPTPYQQTLDALVAFRNDHLGHGANRQDETELADLLRHALLGGLDARRQQTLGLRPQPPLARGLAWAVDLGPWQGLSLQIAARPASPPPAGEEPGERVGDLPLMGAASLVTHHSAVPPAAGAAHIEDPAPLVLVRAADGARLPLDPYLAARVCALCGYRDVFFFNGWDRRRHRFDLLDYQPAIPGQKYNIQKQQLIACTRVLHMNLYTSAVMTNNIMSNSFNKYCRNE